MSALLRKEIRLMLPSWVTAMILALAPLLLARQFHEPMDRFSFLLPIGLILLAVTSFGREFSLGTFSLMLVQPVPRPRFWRMKAGVLLGAMASVILVFRFLLWMWPQLLLTNLVETAEPGVVVTENVMAELVVLAIVVSGGLWTTLLLQQMVGAFWFVGLVPAVIGGLIAWPLQHFQVSHSQEIIWSGLALYSVLGVWWSYRLLERAQDASWTGGTVSLPAWLMFRKRDEVSAVTRPRHPLRALIGKEIQFQQISLAASAVLFVLYVAGAVARRSTSGDTSEAFQVVMGLTLGLWFIVPMLVGCVSVAEERKLGTMESQLCQPVSGRVQFAIKLLCSVLLGGVLSAVLQWTALGLGEVLDPDGFGGSIRDKSLPFHLEFRWLCVGEVALALIAFFGSTLTRNIIHALLASMVATAFFWSLGVTLVNVDHIFDVRPWSGWLPLWIGVPVFVLTVLGLAYANFKRVEVGWNIWRRNLVVVAVTLGLVVTATGAIYNRVWENFQSLEPAHGPARLSGSLPPKICGARTNLYVLLPDGRLWTMAYQLIYEPTVRTNRGHMEQRVRDIVPGGGQFFGTNQWRDLAGGYFRIMGIQADGSLWSLGKIVMVSTNRSEFVSRPERIGTDSDWKAVTYGYNLLLVKENGTLWEFKNRPNQPDGEFVKTNLVQVGNATDWISAFVPRGGGFAAVKSDGSFWRWGSLTHDANWHQLSQSTNYPAPMRWNLEGTNIVAFLDTYDYELVVRSDGSAWASGWLDRNFGYNPQGVGAVTNFVRVDRTADWRQVTAEWSYLAVLRRDGSLWTQKRGPRYGVDPRGNPKRFSTHRDWRVIEQAPFGEVLALAADGTLSCWRDAFADRERRTLLGPTRKPVWSVNILADTASP